MKLLCIDDHWLVREGVQRLIRDLAPDTVVVEAEDCEEALANKDSIGLLDMILLDLQLPGVAGLAAVDTIREAYPDTPVVILSAETNAQLVLRTFEHGAMGFIPKSFKSEIMQDALKLIMHGGIYVPPSVLKTLHDDVEASEKSALEQAAPVDKMFSPRQKEVLKALLEGASNKVIARRMKLSEGTVKAHVSSVLHILGASNRTSALIRAAALKIELS